jgi:hypothetical protein
MRVYLTEQTPIRAIGMNQSLLTLAVTFFTAICLAALLWAYYRHREERRGRKQGIVTIPVGAGHMVTAGCLGVLAYLGLLFVSVTLTFDLVQQTVAPDWLAWVVAIGLLAGFFIMAGWAVFGIGDSFAMTRLAVDKERIRLIRRGRPRTVIFWDKRWRLERMARVQPLGIPALGGATGYTLLMRLRQGHKELLLAFDVSGREVGGLPPYNGRQQGLNIGQQAEWLRSEILFRHERWEEAPGKRQLDTAVNLDELSALAPEAALKDALNFGDEDLVQNRDGLASNAQTSVIREDLKLALVAYLILVAAFGAGALYTLLRLLQGGSFDALGPWLIVLLLAVGFCSLMAMINVQHLRSKIFVDRVSGQIRLQHYRRSDEYWLRIGDEAYPITKQLGDVLKNEVYYHLYIARFGIGAQDARLLSAEELELP